MPSRRRSRPLEAAFFAEVLDDALDAGVGVVPEEIADQGVVAGVDFALEELEHLGGPAAFVLLHLLRLAQGEAEDVVVDLADQLEPRLGIDVERGDGLQGLLEVAHPVRAGTAVAETVEGPAMRGEGVAGAGLGQGGAPVLGQLLLRGPAASSCRRRAAGRRGASRVQRNR